MLRINKEFGVLIDVGRNDCTYFTAFSELDFRMG